jgi:hypothetical protein
LRDSTAITHIPQCLGHSALSPTVTIRMAITSWYLTKIGITRSPLKSHRFSDPRNNVSMETLFNLFINHGNHDDSFVEVVIHICMVFGYDLLCDLLKMLNLINIGNAVATRRNLVDPIQRSNRRGLMAERFSVRFAHEGYRWILLFVLFFSNYLLFLCVIFFDVFFNIIPFLFFKWFF